MPRQDAATINQALLDHNDVNIAIANKMDRMLNEPHGSAREDAPSGDREEPTGS